MPQLIRNEDGAGSSGPIFIQCKYNTKTKEVEKREPRDIFDIVLGWDVRVGNTSLWTAPPVEEILEKTENSLTFQTKTKSVYTIRN